MSDAESGGIDIGDAAGLLAAVVEHTAGCVAIIDLDGRIVSWNPSCERDLGWSAAEVIGRVLPHMLPRRGQAGLALIRSVADAGAPLTRDEAVVTADGWRRMMRTTYLPVADSDGAHVGVLALMRDSGLGNGEKQAQERFTLFVKRMYAEPLGALANAATLLARPEVAADPERRNALLSTIITMARDMAVFVDDMQVSVADRARPVLERSLVDVGALLTDVAAAVGGAGRVLVDFDPGSASACIDRDRASRAFGLLIRSALASAQSGATVYASAKHSGRAVIVEVTYKGTLPVKRVLNAVLEGASSGQLPDVPQAWAGLHYVRVIAEAHGGTLNAMSGRNGDVTFTVSLVDDEGTARRAGDAGRK